MWQKLVQIWKIRDLRNSIVFVLVMLLIFRFAAHIPIPGIDIAAFRKLFENNQFLGLLNVFSGGGMKNFSVVALGIGPYITSSIIFQLLIMIVPSLERLSKEGEHGHKKINQYTRLLTIPLAAIQGFSMISLLQRSGRGIIGSLSPFQMLTIIATLTAGTIFLMWLGELISEKKIGNGISILIFAGIVSYIPSALGQTLSVFDKTQIINLVIFAAIALVTIVGVVILTEGQRNVPVSYAKRIRGIRMYGGTDTYLPLRVNMGGVIPIIFAISIIIFPPMVAQFLKNAQAAWVVKIGDIIINVFNNQIFYGVSYFVLVVAFTYFYTFVVFHPQQIAENLQKQGGFIPGIRPGNNTADYLNKVVSRIILGGALFLGIIAILPLIMKSFTGMQTLVIGGTSLLIVVSVVIDIVKQVESQLTMRDYEGF